MTKKAGRSMVPFIDEEIRERIRKKVGIRNVRKASERLAFLVVSVSAATLLGFIAAISVPVEFRRTFTNWALVHWAINFIWTIIVGIAWITPPAMRHRRLSKKESAQLLRRQTIWFHFYRVGLALLVSSLMLLMGLGLLKHKGLDGWVDGIAIGIYVLMCVIAFLKRRFICRTKLEGWSAKTPLGRLLLRFVVISAATTAAICSAFGRLLGRVMSRVISKSLIAAILAPLPLLMAYVLIPQIVYDLVAGSIHLRTLKERSFSCSDSGG